MSLRDRVTEEFLTQVKIDSLSLQEEKMFEYLKKRLENLDVQMSFQDYEVEKIGMKSTNLIVKIPSNAEGARGIFFDAHVDTVEPGLGIKPVVEGEIIKSDGTTILGSDDKAGSSPMVIAIEEILKEDFPHGDLYFLFTSAEEIGLFGVQFLDTSKMHADFGFILDSHGSSGGVVIAAPYHYKYEIDIRGRAAHAGIEPEKGISAIKIAAELVRDLPQGRINEDTVTNVGLIEGGKATNIIAEECKIRGEFRTQKQEDIPKLVTIFESVVSAHRKKAEEIKIEIREEYPGFYYEKGSEILSFTEKAIQNAGFTPRFEKTGGGSNTNIYNKNGIKSVTLSCGMSNVHSTDEFIKMDDLEGTLKIILSLSRLTAEKA